MAVLPLVSVVVVSYNRRRFLPQALRSAERQNYPNMELLVVDDGSTDGTAELLRRRRWKVPTRVFAFPVNHGPAFCRRHAVEKARGEWVAFLDSDDLWYPDKLREQIENTSRDVDFVYSDMDMVSRIGRLLRRRCSGRIENLYYLIRFARSRWGLPFYPITSAVLARRAVIRGLGSFDTHFRYMCDDTDMWLRILRSVGPGRVRCLPRALAQYRFHGGQITGLIKDVHRKGRHTFGFLLERAASLDRRDREKIMDLVYFDLLKHRSYFRRVGLKY